MTDIIFTGSRTLTKKTVYKILTRYNITGIYMGDCKTGGDKHILEYAKEHHIHHEIYPALWKIYGRAAGPVRNKLMVENAKEQSPDVFGIAICKNNSKGTTDTIKQFIKNNIQYKAYYIKGK